ncbi:MAG: Lrp/AsnC family transcriptional regulator [Telmatospirillum sp.]|nr:Lrp/AsnC family transcriptional regulator [Telmatospirillum sp.]
MLDALDKKILSLLQTDASRSMVEIAEAVHLSHSPCWRRLQRLEEEGYIKRRVAILDREKLNCGLTAFIAIRTNQHSLDWFEAFHRLVADMPEVLDFHRLSGEIDYLIRVVVPDMKAYDQFYMRLISKIAINDVSSMFSMEEIKSSTELPLDYVRVREV